MRLRNTDLFAAVNVGLFAALCAAVYEERLIEYLGRGNLREFLVYAAGVLALIVGAWLSLRRAPIPSSLLILMQVGIMAHFAGAFVPVAGHRLYDTFILGLGYDKYVHFLNAFAGSAIVSHLFSLRRGRPGAATVHPLAILMVVLGVGSMVEILEYVVSLNMPDAGVGGYDNNLQDLIANFVGGATFLLVRMLAPKPIASSVRHAEA